MKYRDIQSIHEEAVVDSFKGYLKEQAINLVVVDRPDPPDAVVNIDGAPSWVEITDAFQSAEWAQSITSYAADDKTHKPYTRKLIYEPDIQSCEKVQEVILKKVTKDTMKVLSKTKGLGILLVGIYTPLISPEEIIDLAGSSINVAIKEHDPVFSSIYLYTNTEGGHAFLLSCVDCMQTKPVSLALCDRWVSFQSADL
jgi:hypothetical protein